MIDFLISIRGVLALIIVIGLLPLIGAMVAGTIAQSLGCELSDANAAACLFHGRDIGGMLYKLHVWGWFGVITVPLALCTALMWGIAEIIHVVGR